jgi:hypothetical protein
MKTYLAVYNGTPASMAKWNELSEAEQAKRQQAGIAAWHAWVDHHKDVIVDVGAPLGTTKRITESGISDIRNSLTGYTLVKAESHEAAAKLFENHPHFTIFPGDDVEVMECMPIPGR